MTTLVLKAIPKLPGAVLGTSPIVVTAGGLNYTVSLNLTALRASLDNFYVSLSAPKATPYLGGYVSGRYYVGAGLGGGATSAAYAANTVYFFPFIVSETKSWDRLAFEVQTAGTAANARVAIYTGANGKPASLVLDAGSFAVAGTGLKTVTINQSLPPGVYWLAVVLDGTETLYNSSNVQLGLFAITGTTTSISAPETGLSASLTFGAFPATAFTGAMGAATYAAVSSPILAARVV